MYHSNSVFSALSSSWSSRPPLAIKYRLDTGALVESGGGKSHGSTLERLLAWEKKLYGEVKVIIIPKFHLFLFFFCLIFFFALEKWKWACFLNVITGMPPTMSRVFAAIGILVSNEIDAIPAVEGIHGWQRKFIFLRMKCLKCPCCFKPEILYFFFRLIAFLVSPNRIGG